MVKILAVPSVGQNTDIRAKYGRKKVKNKREMRAKSSQKQGRKTSEKEGKEKLKLML